MPRHGKARRQRSDRELTFTFVEDPTAPPLDLDGARALLVRLAIETWRDREKKRILQLPDSSQLGIRNDRPDPNSKERNAA